MDRLTKEILAYATTVTSKSPYGISFCTNLLRRRGVDDDTLLEIMAVVRYFNGITKLADLLQLKSELTDEQICDTRVLTDIKG